MLKTDLENTKFLHHQCLFRFPVVRGCINVTFDMKRNLKFFIALVRILRHVSVFMTEKYERENYEYISCL